MLLYAAVARRCCLSLSLIIIIQTFVCVTGMLDGDGKFSGVAAKELREETGLEVDEQELVDMTADMCVCVLCTVCCEQMSIFVVLFHPSSLCPGSVLFSLS